MKYTNTKSVIVSVGIVILTWLFISFIGWLTGDWNFKQACTAPETIAILVFLGWIPLVAYFMDLEGV